MTEPSETLAVVVTRIEGAINTLAKEVESQGKMHSLAGGHVQRGLDDLKAAIQSARDEARMDSTGVRVALEGQVTGLAIDLADHERSVNPHPPQEEWLRADMKALAAELRLARQEFSTQMSGMKTAMDTATGGGKVLWAIGGTIALALVGVGSSLLTSALGG